MAARIGVVGARGHTGSELLAILRRHTGLEVAYAASRQLTGDPVPGFDGLLYETGDPDHVAGRDLEAVFLALPDGAGAPYVDALGDDTVIVDISADRRFDPGWVYGLPELRREEIAGSRRIANPGCYATVMQLALAPLLSSIRGVPAVFGVSGYSGAGTTPGPRNDPMRLADNLVPYRLVGHTHEREATHHLGRRIRFMPHVHQAFRGLLVTAHLPLADPVETSEVIERFEAVYASEPLVDVQEETPELRDGAGRTGVLLGGFDVSDDGHNVVVVGVEDNLLKGAAVQAVQNMNLAMGFPELTGIL
jgi:N-acetyl-gamma-glutamyl-phosphate reductase